MQVIAHIAMQTNELRMCAIFDQPHLLKTAAHALRKDAIHLHGEVRKGWAEVLLIDNLDRGLYAKGFNVWQPLSGSLPRPEKRHMAVLRSIGKG